MRRGRDWRRAGTRDAFLFPPIVRLAPISFLLAVGFLASAGAQAPHTHEHEFGDAEKRARIFDDPKRDPWQKPHEVINALALKPDAMTADISARTGYTPARSAPLLPKGRHH